MSVIIIIIIYQYYYYYIYIYIYIYITIIIIIIIIIIITWQRIRRSRFACSDAWNLEGKVLVAPVVAPRVYCST